MKSDYLANTEPSLTEAKLDGDSTQTEKPDGACLP